MKKSAMYGAVMGIVGIFVSAAALGAPTMSVVDGKYVIDVPTNEEYTLTADDVATMMDEDNAAYPLAKKGEGTLIVGAVMENYTNAIYILEGQYKSISATSFGTTNGIRSTRQTTTVPTSRGGAASRLTATSA